MSGHQSLFHAVKVSRAISPVDAATSAVNGQVGDRQGYLGHAVVVELGNITGTIDAKVQESTTNDGNNMTDVSGAAITQVAATGDNGIVIIDVKHDTWTKRYFRVVVTPTGGTANLISAQYIQYNPDGPVPITQAAAQLIKA